MMREGGVSTQPDKSEEELYEKTIFPDTNRR